MECTPCELQVAVLTIVLCSKLLSYCYALGEVLDLNIIYLVTDAVVKIVPPCSLRTMMIRAREALRLLYGVWSQGILNKAHVHLCARVSGWQ